MMRSIEGNKQLPRNMLLQAASVCLISILLSACTKGGSITSSSGRSFTANLSVTKVFPSSATDAWVPIVASSRFYIKGLALSLTGVCDRGIMTVKISEGTGNYPETGTCLDGGTWTFSKTYLSAQEGDKTLTITGYGIDDLPVTGASSTVNVRIDNTPPSAPVITSPGSSPYLLPFSTTSYTVVGSCSCIADNVVKITGPGGVEIFPSGDSWTYIADVSGDGNTMTFFAWDLATNQSGGRTQVFEKSQTLKLSGGIPGGMQTDGVTGFKLESSVFYFPAKKLDTVSGYTVLTGFASIINEEGHR